MIFNQFCRFSIVHINAMAWSILCDDGFRSSVFFITSPSRNPAKQNDSQLSCVYRNYRCFGLKKSSFAHFKLLKKYVKIASKL